jgi:translation elongation factor EF-Tu-like GTPase
VVYGIKAFRKRLDAATTGDNIGLLFSSRDKTEVTAGDVLTSVGGPTIW